MTQTPDTRKKVVIGAALLLVTALLLFTNLGYGALWDDEATIALFAKTVWRTGDTTAVLDHNIIAYDWGYELKDLRNRYMPPLSFYLAAPFVGLLGPTALAARLPFAICGLLTVALIAYWMWRDNADVRTWLLMALGIVGNVSLMLHLRQCRYFGPCILASTLLAYLYMHWNGRPRTLFAMAIVSLGLLASNYMSYLAFYAAMAIDYLLWHRKRRMLKWPDWLVFLGPQVLLGGALFYKYNMVLSEKEANLQSSTWLVELLRLPLWYLREMNSCEFGVLLLIVAAPLLYRYAKDPWLVRGPAAILSYLLAVVVIAPQLEAAQTSVATVRYLTPLIPLCIYVAVIAIRTITAGAPVLAWPLAVLAFFTNTLHGGPLTDLSRPSMFNETERPKGFRSTFALYVKELIHPPPSTYAATADWINKNAQDKDSIWVLPRYATYPLMYHAPKATYAWQLEAAQAKDFPQLAPIHFRGRVFPKYVIAFGPKLDWVTDVLHNWQKLGLRYSRIATIDGYYYDLTRPELFWHAFAPVRDFDKAKLAVYVFKRDPPVGPPVRPATTPVEAKPMAPPIS